MADLKEWHVGIKFYLKLGKTTTETSDMLKVAFVEQWEEHKSLRLSKFKSSVTSVEDAEHSECPVTSKTGENGLSERTHSQKQKNYYHEVADILGIIFLSVQCILKDNMNLMPNLSPTCLVCA
jgi:hypothetical protein